MERGFRNNLRQMLHSNLNSNQEIGKWEENKQSLHLLKKNFPRLNLRSKLLNLPASENVRKRPVLLLLSKILN